MTEIDFKKAGLEDRDLINHYFSHHTSRSCERTFANVYLWARFYNTVFAVVEDTLVFRSSDDEGRYSFAFPAGEPANIKKAIDRLTAYCEERGMPFTMYTVTPDNFELLEKLYPGRFEITYDDGNADYIYESEKLATLSGKKLHGKRNHINKFKSLYDGRWSYEPITKENLEDCFQMGLQWRKENGCDDDEEKNAEVCVTLNSLRLFEELELVGGVLRIDGEVAAFTIGEPLCSDTFVVHIEKAFADIDGAYTMINQQFVRHACMDYKYVNREEDTGSEGIRQAKRSYRPVFMVEKGFVREKGSSYDC